MLDPRYPPKKHAYPLPRVVMIAVAVSFLLSILPAPAAAAPAAPAPLGMDIPSIGALTAAGAAPRYGSIWAGEWMATSGWGGFDSAMKSAKAAGVTPVVYWYYWGDSISPTCVDNGCNSRDRAEWTRLTDELAAHITTTMGGATTLVVLENEFNKGGITGTYAPTFDAQLETVAKKLKAVAGVKIIVGFGAWSEDNWAKFPKTIAQSDYIGFQMMRASTRDSEASYRGAADRVAYYTGYIAQNFNKPSFLYDVALSSYPDARWATIQAETLEAIFAKLSASGSTGLQGIVYRSLKDTYMDPKNYFGAAESHWGLKKSDGTAKPAWNVWVARASGSPAPAPAPAPTPAPAPAPSASFAAPGSIEAEKMVATKGGLKTDASASGGAAWNLWSNGNLDATVEAQAGAHVVTVRAYGQPAGGVDPVMEIRVGATTLATFSVPAGGYRSFVANATLPAGNASLSVVYTNDAIVAGVDRNLIVDVVSVARAPPPPPPATPPPASEPAAPPASPPPATEPPATPPPASEPPATPPPASEPPATPPPASEPPATPPPASEPPATPPPVSEPPATPPPASEPPATPPPVSEPPATPPPVEEPPTMPPPVEEPPALPPVVEPRPTNRAPWPSLSIAGSGLAFAFDARGTTDADGDAITYVIEFGDGSSSIGPQALHTYAQPGTYLVKLRVSDGTANATLARTVLASAPPPPAPVAPKPLFGATFAPHGGNEWWVQVKIGATRPIASVCARIDGGACQPLGLKPWGSWAASYHAPAGSVVTFTVRSATGETVTSPSFAWPNGKPVASAPPPASKPWMGATFTPYDGNEWWVQVRVSSNLAVKSVCARIDGGDCRSLSWKSWGAWAASLHAPTGSTVVFRATGPEGQTVDSPTYRWPVK